MAKEEMIGAPGIGASDAEIRQAHSDAIHRNPAHQHFRDAQANESAGKGVPFHTQAAAPMAVGAKMNAAITTDDATKGGISSTPISARYATPLKRKPEDF